MNLVNSILSSLPTSLVRDKAAIRNSLPTYSWLTVTDCTKLEIKSPFVEIGIRLNYYIMRLYSNLFTIKFNDVL